MDEIQTAVEMLKMRMFFDIAKSASVPIDDKFEDFLLTLVKNGCPAQSVLDTIYEMHKKNAEKEEMGDEQNG